jgi:hypothetical protein
MPDMSMFIINSVLWRQASTSLSVAIITTQHSLGPGRQTDRHCVHFTHTPKVFARLTSTLQNVNYFSAGNDDDMAYVERQTSMQYGVQQHPPQASTPILKGRLKRERRTRRTGGGGNKHEPVHLNNTAVILFTTLKLKEYQEFFRSHYLFIRSRVAQAV